MSEEVDDGDTQSESETSSSSEEEHEEKSAKSENAESSDVESSSSEEEKKKSSRKKRTKKQKKSKKKSKKKSSDESIICKYDELNKKVEKLFHVFDDIKLCLTESVTKKNCMCKSQVIKKPATLEDRLESLETMFLKFMKTQLSQKSINEIEKDSLN